MQNLVEKAALLTIATNHKGHHCCMLREPFEDEANAARWPQPCIQKWKLLRVMPFVPIVLQQTAVYLHASIRWWGGES